MFKELIGMSEYDAVSRCDAFNILARKYGYDAAYVYGEV